MAQKISDSDIEYENEEDDPSSSINNPDIFNQMASVYRKRITEAIAGDGKDNLIAITDMTLTNMPLLPNSNTKSHHDETDHPQSNDTVADNDVTPFNRSLETSMKQGLLQRCDDSSANKSKINSKPDKSCAVEVAISTVSDNSANSVKQKLNETYTESIVLTETKENIHTDQLSALEVIGVSATGTPKPSSTEKVAKDASLWQDDITASTTNTDNHVKYKKLTNGQISLIVQHKLHLELEEIVPDCIVNFQPDRITIEGKDDELQKAVAAFQGKFMDHLKVQYQSFEQETVTLLNKQAMFHYFMNLFPENGIKASYDVVGNGINVCALDENDSASAIELIKSNIVVQEIKFDYDTGAIYSTISQTFSKSLSSGLVGVSLTGNTIKVVGIKSEVLGISQSVQVNKPRADSPDPRVGSNRIDF